MDAKKVRVLAAVLFVSLGLLVIVLIALYIQ